MNAAGKFGPYNQPRPERTGSVTGVGHARGLPGRGQSDAVGFLVGMVCAIALLTTGRDRRSQVTLGPFMIIGALAVSLTTG